ncbi:MAG: DNA primase [Staphylococcus sp.]|nr:DNA primase [Staphylococcus sp.]
MISDRDKERLLDVCNIEDVIGRYVELRKDGQRLKGCCPFHSERTPSFVVTPAKGMYYCFGCKEGGDVISFVKKQFNLTYAEAVKWLAKEYNVEIEDNSEKETAEQRKLSMERESMFAANKAAARFFASRIMADDDRARFALDYARKRWGSKFVETEGIGFAPGSRELITNLTDKGFSAEILVKVGLAREKDGRIYDAFYNRVTIPIKDRTGNVIGFTARVLDDSKPKYINSCESPIYVKNSSIFGINNAVKQGAKEELFYLVEGAPDVLRLQSLEVYNTIAPLGSAWTENQFKILRRFNPRLCFIPDMDPPKGEPYGTGITSVIKNGLAAMEAGFAVTVKEIPVEDQDEKQDPDSYFKSRKMLEELPEEDFILWYAGKLSIGKATTAEKSEVVKTISALLAKIDDKLRVQMYVKQLSKLVNVPAGIITNVINEKVTENVIGKSKRPDAKLLDREFYQRYGFEVRGNQYWSMSKDGDDREWSNFVMEPLFHIQDQMNPKRLYKLTNIRGYEKIMEFRIDELVSIQSFRCKTEGAGNFIWKAGAAELNRLKEFLYENTETATEITQLGWQKKGFFAFGNGVHFEGQWYPVDDYGIVRLGDVGNYYLPAASRIFLEQRDLFQFERRFVHTNFSTVTFRKYTDKLLEVFGDNGKVGICFFLATLFKDVVTAVTKNFPMLNLFGPKGSGKSELGHSLMSFFIIKNEPPNISTSTEAALGDTIAQCSNALVHLDEYKNSIELQRREILKGLYDGVGRTRMNMDRDKKRQTTAVDCGIIVSGQEMPTIDIALFSRMLFCTFNKTEFSQEAKRRFDELKQMRDAGCSHLVLQLLKHRKKFEHDFPGFYKSALTDVIDGMSGAPTEDRILRNWVVILAAFRTLMPVIDVGFDYAEMLKVCIESIKRQDAECKSTNEISAFWQAVDFLHQNGEIFSGSDYRIKYEKSFSGRGLVEKIVWPTARPILYLSTKRVMMLYKKNGKAVGDTTLPVESLRFYLENSKEYLGFKNSVRFQNYSNQRESTVTVPQEAGGVGIRQTSRVDWALAFDYLALKEAYCINLEVDVYAEDDDN